ncbi:MAG: hypothetical protein ABIK25_07230 [Pseudomonadota bacterium]
MTKRSYAIQALVGVAIGLAVTTSVFASIAFFAQKDGQRQIEEAKHYHPDVVVIVPAEKHEEETTQPVAAVAPPSACAPATSPAAPVDHRAPMPAFEQPVEQQEAAAMEYWQDEEQ